MRDNDNILVSFKKKDSFFYLLDMRWITLGSLMTVIGAAAKLGEHYEDHSHLFKFNPYSFSDQLVLNGMGVVAYFVLDGIEEYIKSN